MCGSFCSPVSFLTPNSEHSTKKDITVHVVFKKCGLRKPPPLHRSVGLTDLLIALGMGSMPEYWG
jgi:hypothetical protein